MQKRLNGGRRGRSARRAPARRGDAHFQELIDISPNWYYWEHDRRFRFTRMFGPVLEKSGVDPKRFIGKTRWQIGLTPVGDGSLWEARKAVLRAHEPFSDFIFQYTTPDGDAHFVSVSGQPMFDRHGRFRGYRGISKDVTRRIWHERRLLIERGVTRLLADTSDIAAAARGTLSVVADALKLPWGAYWQLDPPGGEFCCIETWGDAETLRGARQPAGTHTAGAGGLIQRICVEGKPAWAHDAAADRAQEKAAAFPLGAFAFPIRLGPRVIGVMEFRGLEPHRADAELFDALIYVGDALGQFCERKREEEELLRFRAAMDMSGDSIYLVDRATMRFIDVNARASQRVGYTREELLQMGPQDLLTASREELEREYDEVIASGTEGIRTEHAGHAKDGSPTIAEVYRRALRIGGRWIIVALARDISARRLAERHAHRLATMYAALGATNEAILRAKSTGELYQRVCEAAVYDGKFIRAAVLIPDAQTGQVEVAAVAGPHENTLRALSISIDEALPEGRGLAGIAFRTQKPCISNDYGSDARTLPWRTEAHSMNTESAAAIPLLRDGRAVGVLLFNAAEKQTFDDEVVKLLERVAENTVFALDNFKRDAERRRADEARRRSMSMYAALSATNEAIMRAASPEQLFQLVCDAAVHGGNFRSASILLIQPDSSWLRLAAVTSMGPTVMREIRVSIDPECAEGHGLIGPAIRSGKPNVSNHLGGDPHMRPWADVLEKSGARSGAALPIFRSGRTVGALAFYSLESGAFDGEVVKLLEHMAANVSFALDNFDRESERARAARALQESEAKYRAILENMEEGYFEVDLAGNYTFFNDALCRLQGYTREEMRGMNYRRYMDDETAKYVFRIYNKVFVTRNPERLTEWAYIRKDGSRGIFESSVQLLLNADGAPTGFGGIVRDVTERRQAQEALRASEERYRTILEDIQDAYYEVDLRGNLVFFNSAFCRMLDRPEEQLLGANNREYQTPEVAARVYKTFNEVYRSGTPTTGYDWEMLRSDGTRVLAEGSVQLVRNANGQAVGFRGMLRDVTARRQMERALRESESRFRALTELSSDWYWEQDAEIRFTRVESNRADTEMTRTSMLGKRPWETGYQPNTDGGWTRHRATVEAHESYRDLVLQRSAPDGTVRYISVSGEPVFDDTGCFSGYRGVAREITEQKIAEERIQYLATHDGLTGLPNRTMFSEMLNLALESARRYRREFPVLFIDLDRFKVINDTLGHEAGDILLKEMSTRLKQTLRASDFVARLGGDEFVVLAQEAAEARQISTIAEKLLANIALPVSILGQECRVTASIGISVYPTDAQDEQALMRNADIAMYQAKEEGKNTYQFYSKEIKAQSLERLTLEAALRHALEREEFSLHYQPKINLATGVITGVEALLRWNHPERGMIAPAQFIPLAEETGLIVPIGKWVLRTACAQSVAWQHAGLAPVHMAVNLSLRQFADDGLLVEIDHALASSGLAPQLLELEITEGVVAQNTERAVRVLTEIQRRGVRLAIDDFGTGYSSLAQIKRFPIDTLKVDRSFVRDVPHDPEDRAIAEAIIALGKSLGLTVVAEGVETAEQAEFFRRHGCDEMQGYYFSKPLTAAGAAELLHVHAGAMEATGLPSVRNASR